MGFKRALGFGTLFAILLTAGFWILTIPFYPKRCMACGLTKNSTNASWFRDGRFASLVVLACIISVLLLMRHEADEPRDQSAPIIKGPDYNEVPSRSVQTVVKQGASDATANRLRPDSIVANQTSSQRLTLDQARPQAAPQYVRNLKEEWNRPTLLYSDEAIKVLWAFEDQLGLEGGTLRGSGPILRSRSEYFLIFGHHRRSGRE
jgi:hypothetical protein